MNTFDIDLATVANNGGTIPEELTALQERSARYFDFPHHFTERFAQAVADDAPEDQILNLRALALIEQTANPIDQAAVTAAMQQEANRRIRALYTTVATANWDTLADRFNTAAAAFTKAHSTVPVTTDPATLINAPERSRKAWAEGQTQRATLDGLIEPLLAAARLAGHVAAGKTWAIGATVTATGIHRRRIWEAWDHENRWADLIELGATIHAPELDELAPYREPAPIETRMERGGIGWTPVQYDPEDNITTTALTTDDLANHLEPQEA